MDINLKIMRAVLSTNYLYSYSKAVRVLGALRL